MPPEPVPADPEWDDDPAWSRPDPMTAAELEASRAGWAARWEKAAHDERRAMLRMALRGQLIAVGPPDPADPADVKRRLTRESPDSVSHKPLR